MEIKLYPIAWERKGRKRMPYAWKTVTRTSVPNTEYYTCSCTGRHCEHEYACERYHPTLYRYSGFGGLFCNLACLRATWPDANPYGKRDFTF